MQITVKGRHVGISAKLNQHVQKRLEAAIGKYFGNAIVAQVDFTREKRMIETGIVIHVGSGITLQASGDADDVYNSFDVAADRVTKRLRRYKRKLRDHHREQAGRQRDSVPAQQYVLAAEAEDEAAEEDEPEEMVEPEAEPAGGPIIVAESTTQIDTMSVGEAVMRMDLAELPAMMFRNSSHGGMNVVYRRPDGNIGWIDPKQSEAAS